jgi:hypothetical protein
MGIKSYKNILHCVLYRVGIFALLSFLNLSLFAAEKNTLSINPFTIGMVQYLSAEGDSAPSQNVPNLFDLVFNGVENAFGADDIVAIKITASYPEQGYTNSNCLKIFIQQILNRKGGFNGKIVIFDNIHYPEPDKQSFSGWAAKASEGKTRHNGDNINSLIKEFENTNKVFKVHLEDASINPDNCLVLDPDDPKSLNLPKGKNGWFRYRVSIPNSGRDVTLSVPVFSLPDGTVINLSSNGGIYKNGEKTNQPLKLIIASPLNFHSRYAGVEGSIRAHFGLVELPGGTDIRTGHFEDGSLNLYTLGYPEEKPEWIGTAIGIYIKKYLYPATYICFAEWSGFAGMFGAGTAAHTKVIGICNDPVTLDYYMGKYVLFRADQRRYWNNPENDYAFGKMLKACFQQGIGTIDENEMTILLYDFDNPPTRVHDWIFIQ